MNNNIYSKVLLLHEIKHEVPGTGPRISNHLKNYHSYYFAVMVVKECSHEHIVI
jgi:hypothetical protein